MWCLGGVREIVEGRVLKDFSVFWWGFPGKGIDLLVDPRSKGEAAMVQHLLRGLLVGSLDSKVVKHGF